MICLWFLVFWLGIVLSCTVWFRHVMRTAQYTVRYTVIFSACTYPIRSQWVRLPVRCSADICAGYEWGYEWTLGSSQTCNIRLPWTLYTQKFQWPQNNCYNSNSKKTLQLKAIVLQLLMRCIQVRRKSLNLDRYKLYFLMILKKTFLPPSNPVLQYL